MKYLAVALVILFLALVHFQKQESPSWRDKPNAVGDWLVPGPEGWALVLEIDADSVGMNQGTRVYGPIPKDK